jgi:probable F420-dependent oxidoreductase
LKYSLSLFPLDNWSSLDEIVATVQRAEQLGFYSIGLAEHLVTPVSGPGRAPELPSQFWVDNFAFGAALAMATSRIRLMLSALIVPYRHPLHAAKGIATLDWISGGRLDVTTGVGWLRQEFDVLGIPFAERGARTDDYLRAMITLWTQEYPEYRGRFAEFSNLVSGPPCVQKPHVPLLIGGSGEPAFRRVLDFGAGWAPMLASADVVRGGLARIGVLAEQRGRDLSSLRVFTRINVLGGSTAIRQAGAHVPGTPEPIARKAGSAREDVLECVGQFVAAGVNEIGLSFPWATASQFAERLEWFATEVMPGS